MGRFSNLDKKFKIKLSGFLSLFEILARLTIGVCTFFTDRLVHMILRGQIEPKH